MYCQHCGAEQPDTAKFCNSCGAPIAAQEPKPEPEPNQEKGGFFYRYGFLLILIGVAIFAFIKFIYPTTDAGKREAAQAQPVSREAVTAAVDSVLKENFEHYSIEEDGSYIKIYVWADGVKRDADNAKSGVGSAIKAWKSATGSATELRNSVQGIYDDFNVSARVSVIILSGRGGDELYNVSKNGVVYDYVNDK